MKTYYTFTFDNKSDNYVVLGDSHDIIFAGPKEDAETIYNQYDLYDSQCPFSFIEIVEPHQSATHNWLLTDFPVYSVP